MQGDLPAAGGEQAHEGPSAASRRPHVTAAVAAAAAPQAPPAPTSETAWPAAAQASVAESVAAVPATLQPGPVPAAAPAVKAANTETAAPADKSDSAAAAVSQTPSSKVGSASWLMQVMAALGAAVAAGSGVWFLIGSAPQRTIRRGPRRPQE